MDTLVHELVGEYARRHPDRPAVESFTYGQLDARADILAARFSAGSVEPERVVAICLPRGAGLVTASLGVLRAGGGYLPLDPASPAERLRQLVVQSGARLLVTTAELAAWLGADPTTTVLLDDLDFDRPCPLPRSGGATADNLAYVIYPSGSTGTPKGVLINHRSLSNVTELYQRQFDQGPDDRIALIAPPGFDASVIEVWPSLVAGAHLLVPADDVCLSPERLRDWLIAERITQCFLPTPIGELLMALPWPAHCALRVVDVAGDRLRVRPPVGLPFRVVNGYGPTENTVVSTFGPVDSVGPVPPAIGRPVPGVDAHVLDEDLRQVR